MILEFLKTPLSENSRKMFKISQNQVTKFFMICGEFVRGVLYVKGFSEDYPKMLFTSNNQKMNWSGFDYMTASENMGQKSPVFAVISSRKLLWTCLICKISQSDQHGSRIMSSDWDSCLKSWLSNPYWSFDSRIKWFNDQ